MKLLTEYCDMFKNNPVHIMLDIKKNMLEVIRESAFSYYNRIIYCCKVSFLAKGCCFIFLGWKNYFKHKHNYR